MWIVSGSFWRLLEAGDGKDGTAGFVKDDDTITVTFNVTFNFSVRVSVSALVNQFVK